jgi:hypothetical protein
MIGLGSVRTIDLYRLNQERTCASVLPALPRKHINDRIIGLSRQQAVAKHGRRVIVIDPGQKLQNYPLCFARGYCP